MKQSNFIKRSSGYVPIQILLYFVYMLLINKHQSAFVRLSSDAYGKDAYYRFIREKCHCLAQAAAFKCIYAA
ncbi:hypothetical protein [Hydrogenimonas sp.]